MCWVVVCRAFVLALMWLNGGMGFNVTFEEQYVEWQSPAGNFELRSGMDTIRRWGYPRVDVTNGTRQGRFVAASGGGAGGQESEPVIYSPCLNPTGPSCTMHFSVWLSESKKRNEQLTLFLMRFCQYCGSEDALRGDMVTVPVSVRGHGNNSHRWVSHSVELGAIHTLFVVAMVAVLPDNDSVLAIDGIYLQSCGLDLEEDLCGDNEFQCPFTSQCIPRDKLCDLHEDCHCGQDESPSHCELIPSHGRATFRDCDFDTGQCYWYNAGSRDHSGWPWEVAREGTAIEDRILPHFNDSGAYVYASPFSVQSLWTSALLRSVDFPALPDPDGLCAVRFQYWLSGDPELTVQLWELGGQEVRTIWRSDPSMNLAPEWQWVSVVINSEAISSSYILQMQATAESSYRKSAVAIANITLTQECFHQEDIVASLNSCGAQGKDGPTQEMCDADDDDTDDVTVLAQPPFAGAQLWTVPTSAKYSLQAYGAKGGKGKEGTDSTLANGAHVQAKFRLNRGDHLLVIVGQTGQDSLRTGVLEDPSLRNEGATGGGGGGATLVYRRRGDQEPELLLMAGGGGGLDYVSFVDNQTGPLQHGEWANEENVDWVWLTNQTDFTGQGCHVDLAPITAFGGFGAGLGACGLVGGHGGGADLTNTNTSQLSAGQPGAVYVHPDSLSAAFQLWSHPGHGHLEIEMVSWRCPCDYLCLWKHPELIDQAGVKAIQDEVFVCICPPGRVLAPDSLSCVPDEGEDGASMATPGQETPGLLNVGTAVLISVAVILILVVFVVCFFIYVMRSGPQDRLRSLRLVMTRCLRNRSQSLPLHILPASALPARVMHVNPNYSFIASKIPEHKLPEIPRENLRMACQLGQGAFGEVYKGFLSGMSGTEREVPVAAKTLPPLCSEQTELDFYMEAFIVSKFHHPNIVQFLGVCFEQHPRYIVLELLEGGNLKSFLRENRPSQGSLSKLNVGDLLALATDVCRGCCYLEEHHFIHRDIAARNCLLTTKEPGRVAKIADFGMSRDVYRADYYKKEGRALLPLKWMPPEAFMEGVFTSKTDVWSFGVALWEVFTMGYTPYPALSNSEVMNFIYIGGRLDCPEGCPPALYDLMLSCWRQKAEERPGFQFIKQTLDSIAEDTATMSQHLSAFRLPHLHSNCSGRNLKLLNHPVPSLGLTLHPDPSASSTPVVSEPSCTEPLLKAAHTLRYKHLNGQSSKAGNSIPLSRMSTSLDSDTVSTTGSYSSLEPLIPPDTQSRPTSDVPPAADDVGSRLTGETWDVACVEVESREVVGKERRSGQRSREFSPLAKHGDKGISLTSLDAVQENDELLRDELQEAEESAAC